jgi:molybdopterin/thiamine biosynthesis adenylyltransferase
MEKKGFHVVVAGLGNTGGPLALHLARMPEIARVTIVDPEFFEAGNLAGQAIDRVDVDRPKAETMAEKLRRIRPAIGDSGLEVVALQQRIEDVPRGLLLDCDLLVSCLDSKIGRQHLNEIAWRLGKKWADCGVLASQQLVRVNAYVPGEDAPCLECAWGSDEYAALEQQYICGAGEPKGYSTMATSALGALAASLMAIEIRKLLGGDLAHSLAGRQLVLGAEHHVMQLSTLRRNPWCRFDHRSWRVIEPWICPPEATTVGAALSTLGSLQVEGHRFASELLCPGCGYQQKSLRLNRPLARCPACDRRMVTAGFGSLDRIDSALVGEYADLTLAEIGLRAGDIVSGGARYRRIQEAA